MDAEYVVAAVAGESAAEGEVPEHDIDTDVGVGLLAWADPV